ncbi:hypothetical protein Nepgr_010153 [Nepenthes gracilis]|uniref:Heat shock factor binding protein 1 n=1 Tax=Nepenthes gracilis TaxID=150966 RepID=A0AAD3SBQ0_NEPGR|nr:hypothetical protein Nepgr_010153 [Nepenthes gracilis]
MDGHDGDDPKQSTADMTVFVQNLLQQMQSRFQAIFWVCLWLPLESSGFFNDIALDEMGTRIDELEQSINELRAEMGPEGSPSPSAASRPKPEEAKPTDDSA